MTLRLAYALIENAYTNLPPDISVPDSVYEHLKDYNWYAVETDRSISGRSRKIYKVMLCNIKNEGTTWQVQLFVSNKKWCQKSEDIERRLNLKKPKHLRFQEKSDGFWCKTYQIFPGHNVLVHVLWYDPDYSKKDSQSAPFTLPKSLPINPNKIGRQRKKQIDEAFTMLHGKSKKK